MFKKEPSSNSPPSEWVGAIHLHSVYSDGLAKVSHIINFANELGLDYCILTDHNTLRAKDEGYEGYYDDLLFLTGMESTCLDNSHLLCLNIDLKINKGLLPQKAIDAVNSQKGVSILAHAFDQGSRFFKTHYPWKDWSVRGYTAIEMWNFLANWSENVNNLWDLIYGYFFPQSFLTGPPVEAFRRWNELNADKFMARQAPVVIMGSVDAHGNFPYTRSLSSIHTHIWGENKTGIFETDKSNLFTNLAMGRAFIANDWLYPAKGFTFTVEGVAGEYPKKPVIKGPAKIEITLPAMGRIHLYLNEKVVKCIVGKRLEYQAAQEGTYRVEVYYLKRHWLPGLSGYKPWIFSNAIGIRMD
jgi:hypothetical protein